MLYKEYFLLEESSKMLVLSATKGEAEEDLSNSFCAVFLIFEI
jgi:hypothetical protein